MLTTFQLVNFNPNSMKTFGALKIIFFMALISFIVSSCLKEDEISAAKENASVNQGKLTVLGKKFRKSICSEKYANCL
jgi:hypothetical protein